MHGKVWTFARLAIPIDFRLILYGVSGGVLMGMVALFTKSTEEATALGIALAVSVSIGGWLGINLWLMTLRVLRLWSASLTKRLEDLGSRLTPITDDADAPAGAGNVVSIQSVFCSLVPGGFAVAISGAILSVIDLQVDLFTEWAFIPTLFIGLGYAFLGLAVQCWYLWQDSRLVARLERRLESTDAATPVTLQTPRLERAISKAGTIVCKLTGVGCPAGDETAMA